jgi:hypothetical protein
VTTNEREAVRWDGNADTANELFGENYGVDWWYAAQGSSATVISTPDGSRRIEVGDLVNPLHAPRAPSETTTRTRGAPRLPSFEAHTQRKAAASVVCWTAEAHISEVSRHT